MHYDLIIIGSGSGGYVSAIRASQLGMKVAVIEKAELGGTCLNWGCIPTKTLLKSAQVYKYIKDAESYGIKIISIEQNAEGIEQGAERMDKCSASGCIDFPAIIKRSRDVAAQMSKGIQYLFKKNKIDLIQGFGKLKPTNNPHNPQDKSGQVLHQGGIKWVEVRSNEGLKEYSANHIIIATGARARELPNLKIDNKKIINYKDALTLARQPETMLIVGAGPIGCEFAYFYSTIGTKVILVEILPNILPAEDEDISKELSRIFRKLGIDILVNSYIQEADTNGNKCKVKIITPKGEQIIETDVVLSAVGLKSNIENIGLEEVGIKIENDKIVTDEYYRTKIAHALTPSEDASPRHPSVAEPGLGVDSNITGYYAIGDIVKGHALAHVASAEAIICVEKIAGLSPEPLDYNNIPTCIYTSPEIASVGLTEKKAKSMGYEIKVGKFPFIASGKANALGLRDGFVKMIFNVKAHEILGAHMIGVNVTELIAEITLARKLRATTHQILKTIYPHPTMSEAIMEATAAAYGQAIHL